MALHMGENGCYGVMIHNIRNYSDEQLLKEFNKYGKVTSELQKGGWNLVFVQFKEYEEARACLDALQDRPEYFAKPARPRESRPIARHQMENWKLDRRARSVGRLQSDRPAYNSRCKSMNRLENFQREHQRNQSDDSDSDSGSKFVEKCKRIDAESKDNAAQSNSEEKSKESGDEQRADGTPKAGGEGDVASPPLSDKGMPKDVRFNLNSNPEHREVPRDGRDYYSRRTSRPSPPERHHGYYLHNQHNHQLQHPKYSTCQLYNPDKPHTDFHSSMMPDVIGSEGPKLVEIVDLEDAEQIRAQGTRPLYDVLLYNFPLWFMMGDVYDLCSKFVKVLHVDMFYSHDPRNPPYAIIFVGSLRQSKHLVDCLNGMFYQSKRLKCLLVSDLYFDNYTQ